MPTRADRVRAGEESNAGTTTVFRNALAVSPPTKLRLRAQNWQHGHN